LPRHVRLVSNHAIPNVARDRSICLKLKNLTDVQRSLLENIIQQCRLSVQFLDFEIILSGLNSAFLQLNAVLVTQQELTAISTEMAEVLGLVQSEGFQWQIKGRTLNLQKRTHIMGILNITPDSFYDGGKYFEYSQAVDHTLQMVEDGADIIDIGGESTRPGSLPVLEEQEIDRVLPVIEGVRKQSDVPISIDTQKSRVAKLAIEAGANIINDISGLGNDPKIAKLAADFGAGLILMHIKGTPRDMQRIPNYEDVMEEILLFLNNSKNRAFEWGVHPGQIVVDPGIGFGKRWFDNYDIINRLQELKVLNAPILIGASRKSFLNNVLSKDPEDKLEGSLAAHVLAIINGAYILRVHDVKETKKISAVIDSFLERSSNQQLEESVQVIDE